MGKVIKANFNPAQFIQDLAAKAFKGAKLSKADLERAAEIMESEREKRLKLDKESANIKHTETTAEKLIIQQMGLQNIAVVHGKEVKETDEPHVKDWQEFYAYILETQDFSLLERRPGKAAIKERWELKVEVPGIEKFPVAKLVKS